MRRWIVLPVGAALIGATAVLIAVGGSRLVPASEGADPPPVSAGISDDAPNDAPADLEERTVAIAGAAPVASRTATPQTEEVPPSTPGLQRIEPRAPLSKIGTAAPPKPKRTDPSKGTTLFRPVASAAGVVESRGLSIAVAGLETVSPDEQCAAGETTWPCGVHARTAFRAWLRGRSLVCDVPPEADRKTIVADCRMGKQDVGAWLASNGWARATETGPYAELGAAARREKRGIFGSAPPTRAGPSSSATSALPAPPATGESLLDSGAGAGIPEPPAETAAPAASLDTGTTGYFPPAPTPPADPPALPQ